MKRFTGLLIGAGCALLVIALLLAHRDFFGLEPLAYNALTRRVAAATAPDPRIVIVAINNKSVKTLEQFGRPQSYPRSLYKYVIDEARRGGAVVVGFDILFPSPNNLAESDDLLFADALATMPTVLAAQTDSGGPTRDLAPAWSHDVWKYSGNPLPMFRVTTPYETFARASAIGSIRLSGDTSGSRRWALGDLVAPGEFLPSLALAVAGAVKGSPREAALRNGEFVAGPIRVPVNDQGEFSIRWAGRGIGSNPYVYPLVDFDKVVAAGMAREAYESGNGADAGVALADLERFEKEKFAGKIVLVGFTAAGFDIRSTPLQAAIPGIVTHANAIDDLINDRFNREASLPLVCVIFFILAAAAGFYFYELKSQLVTTLLFLAILAAWTAAAYFALSSGVIVPTAAPLAAFLLTFVGSTAASIVAEQSRTKQLRGVFGKYVSPQILEHILENPDRVELGGHRVEMTILFSDIRGFTSISEASEPEEVVEMLNEYLTRMVEILLRYGGTLDKFIGDAVMGFWNAPTADASHALHAVQCAIDMVDETARLRAEWEKEGKPALRIGVGINTGDAVVGNIGSRQVFGYTVIGDAVNLASRLESKNKDYGTEIIISEFTREKIGDAIPTNYLDEVKVKGKEKAVKIYQVKGTIS